MKENPAGRIWLVRLIAFLIVLAASVFAFRIWLKSALGCAGMLGEIRYSDPDELSRMPEETLMPAPVFPDDSAYDRVYPDLLEPVPGE